MSKLHINLGERVIDLNFHNLLHPLFLAAWPCSIDEITRVVIRTKEPTGEFHGLWKFISATARCKLERIEIEVDAPEKMSLEERMEFSSKLGQALAGEQSLESCILRLDAVPLFRYNAHGGDRLFDIFRGFRVANSKVSYEYKIFNAWEGRITALSAAAFI